MSVNKQKMIIVKNTIVLFFFLINILSIAGQPPIDIGRQVNEYQGTIVVREIKKLSSIPKDSSQATIRIFQPFGCLLKGGGAYPYNVLIIDTTGYSIKDGVIKVSLKTGWHKISILASADIGKPFMPFKEVLLKFRKKRMYYFDLCLPLPFASEHH